MISSVTDLLSIPNSNTVCDGPEVHRFLPAHLISLEMWDSRKNALMRRGTCTVDSVLAGLQKTEKGSQDRHETVLKGGGEYECLTQGKKQR